jgi:5-formyltetrahydrofolate cyclo-ligase
MPSAEPRAAKQALRARCIGARDALDPWLRAAHDAAITARLLDNAGYRAASAVALYAGFGSEYDTSALIAAALAGGKRVALPRVERAARALVFHWITSPEADTVAGVWGIREPRASLPAAAPRDFDWMLVPGAAFDASGARIGYGAGYYDRCLPELAARCPRTAACYELQIVECVPVEAHDMRVDELVTEARRIDCRRPPPR